MTLSSPLWLLALAVVAAAAAWALWRPSRQVVDVGSLALWREALESLGRSARRRTRRVTASWLLLLAGAAAATLALARPAIDTAQPARHIALEVYPAAELAGDTGLRELRAAADALFGRLSPADRLQLLRPSAAGGATAWLSPADAVAELARTPALPLPARQLTLPPADPRAQQVVRLAPAGLKLPGGPHTVTVELPTALPPVTLAEFGAAELADGKRMQFFAILQNSGNSLWSGDLTIRTLDPDAPRAWRITAVPLTVPPGGRVSVVRDLPPAAAIEAVPAGNASLLGGAFLVRRSPMRRKIALTGPDEPMLRRYVAADDTLQLVASPAEADFVIANRTAPPPECPALVIDPPAPPPPWQHGPPLAAVTLAPAAAAADDPVMKGVALEGIAVRRVRPWTAASDSVLGPAMKVLASLPQGAVLLRTDGDAAPRRVYVAFELSSDNTNLAVSPSLVALLAGAARWLAPGAAARPVHAFTPPQDCVGAARWERLAGGGPAAAQGPLPWPGIYRDEAGALQAVALHGLRAAEPKLPPAQAVAAIDLPPPRMETAAIQLWFYLLAAAILFWMAGWTMRVK